MDDNLLDHLTEKQLYIIIENSEDKTFEHYNTGKC